ncbi:hypothetical protein BX666DRAFT_816912 [Dichotomocladium elegans]|nr:hypothetical protein BX666DRAFT_816912 [Dichotomocladium elegans]
MSKLGSDSGSGDNRACDSTVTTVLSPPPPAPTRNGRFSPPLLSTQRQQQQRGTASYRFQMTAGNDEDYVYSTANNRAPVHKSEIPQAASAAKNDNKGSGLPYPTSSHAEMTIPYPSEVGASVDVSTGAPSDWYHRRHRSPYYSSSSGTHINDLTNRMAPTAIVDRPLTAFLWDESPRPASNSRPDGGISLPPFPSTSFPSSSPSPRV